MAKAAANVVVTSGTGASDYVQVPPGEHALMVTCATWGDADLQIGDGTTFVDARDSAGVVNFVANKSIAVVGGACYRLDVNTHTAAITLKFLY